MTPEAAETFALRLLAAIAGDQRWVSRMIAQTGITVDQLRAEAGDPALLGGIVDFVLSDDGMAAEICESLGLPPENLLRIRAALPGAAPDW